ncbi:MAG: nucleotidyltransferase domain-containing protein [Deltaproteobacteria bacterium]|nr:nucleotidyltransferase domain-containing protein [Deltaproteobacteria bacterium]
MASLQSVQIIVAQIVSLVNPTRIILFGSSARGTTGPDSDLDILVVMPDGTHRRKTAQLLYKSVRRNGIPLDFVVATEDDLIRHKDDFWTVICPALQEGKVLYAA